MHKAKRRSSPLLRSQSAKAYIMKIVLRYSAIAFFLTTGSVSAQEATFQCEASAQEAGSAQSEPFSIEIRGGAVKLSGVSALESTFSLIRKNDAFYVFKNNKGQGGNINRSNGVVELYAVNATSHKMTVSITGVCSKPN